MAKMKEIKPVPLSEKTSICKLLDGGPWSDENKEKLKQAASAIGTQSSSCKSGMQHFRPSDYFPKRLIDLLQDPKTQMGSKLHQVFEFR